MGRRPKTVISVTTQPQNADLAVGGNLSLTVAATASNGNPITYQWKKNGVIIAGATAARYSKAAVVIADAGVYTVDIFSAGAVSITSQPATVTVN